MESSSEILGANYGKVILDRKYFSFLVQMIDFGYHSAAGGYTEIRVVDKLELLK